MPEYYSMALKTFKLEYFNTPTRPVNFERCVKTIYSHLNYLAILQQLLQCDVCHTNNSKVHGVLCISHHYLLDPVMFVGKYVTALYQSEGSSVNSINKCGVIAVHYALWTLNMYLIFFTRIYVKTILV